jgi:hypothetical protein
MPRSYRFNCRSCGQSVVVDEQIHTSILEDGCLICLAPATEAEFEVVELNESAP